MSELTHINRDGDINMVSVAGKQVTARRAVAQGRVRISAELAEQIENDTLKKGNLFQVARLAGIMAAKKTDELIPLCHSLPLDYVYVEIRLERPFVQIKAQASTTARTGVEMEAFTAVSVAALTVVDMGKAVDKAMVIEDIKLLEKTGGKSGTYMAS